MSVAVWPTPAPVADFSSFFSGDKNGKEKTVRPVSRRENAIVPYQTERLAVAPQGEPLAFVRRLQDMVGELDEEDRQNDTFLHNFESSINRLLTYQELSSYLNRARIYGNEEGGLTLVWKNGNSQIHLVLTAGQPDQDYIYVLTTPPGQVFASPSPYRLREKLERLYVPVED